MSSAEQPKSTWSSTAQVYTHFAKFTNGFANEVVRDALDVALPRIPADRPVRVLDIAAGTGVAAFEAAEMICASGRAAHVTATDLADGMLTQLEASPRLAKLRATHGERCTFEVKLADMCALDCVADHSIDVVTMVFGIMFPPDPVAALREVHRVLAPGGVAVVVSWHWNSLIDDLRDVLVDQQKAAAVEDIVLPFEKFGHEGFMRRLVREAQKGLKGDECQSQSIRFVSRSRDRIPVLFVAESANTNPAIAQYAPIDASAAAQFLASRHQDVAAVDGMPAMPAEGTALVLSLGI